MNSSPPTQAEEPRHQTRRCTDDSSRDDACQDREHADDGVRNPGVEFRESTAEAGRLTIELRRPEDLTARSRKDSVDDAEVVEDDTGGGQQSQTDQPPQGETEASGRSSRAVIRSCAESRASSVSGGAPAHSRRKSTLGYVRQRRSGVRSRQPPPPSMTTAIQDMRSPRRNRSCP